MKKAFCVGVLFLLYWRLFSIYGHPLIICTDDVIGLKFEAIEAQMGACNEEHAQEKIIKYDYNVLTKKPEITKEDAQMLMQIAQAEAGIDGVEGMAMVMAVVLNRVNDDRFPDSIEGVIFQEHQFSPISDGRYYEAVPDDNCRMALREIEEGVYDDIDALYFENAKESWQADNCQYLYTIGHHRFYKN